MESFGWSRGFTTTYAGRRDVGGSAGNCWQAVTFSGRLDPAPRGGSGAGERGMRRAAAHCGGVAPVSASGAQPGPGKEES